MLSDKSRNLLDKVEDMVTFFTSSKDRRAFVKRLSLRVSNFCKTLFNLVKPFEVLDNPGVPDCVTLFNLSRVLVKLSTAFPVFTLLSFIVN